MGLRYEFVPAWERLPEGMSHLDAPGIGTDSDDRVYILGRQSSHVFVYEADGTFVEAWGEASRWVTTHGLTVGPDDHVYLTDTGGHAVEKFSRDGRHVASFSTRGIASATGYDKAPAEQYDRSLSIRRAAGPYNLPCAVAVRDDGHVFVADGYGNAAVHHFTPDSRLVRSWGGPGTGPGEFNLPHGIAVDAHGRVLVADRENERIQVFAEDGTFIEAWTDIQRPTQVRVGQDGLVVVSELHLRVGMRSFKSGLATEDHPSRVSVLDENGAVLARWGQAAGEDATAPGNFTAPHDIAVDSRGDVYVAEVSYAEFGRLGLAGPDCHTVQKFRRV
jgi:DNA-binding beta-propeller fold protein YncE